MVSSARSTTPTPVNFPGEHGYISAPSHDTGRAWACPSLIESATPGGSRPSAKACSPSRSRCWFWIYGRLTTRAVRHRPDRPVAVLPAVIAAFGVFGLIWLSHHDLFSRLDQANSNGVQLGSTDMKDAKLDGADLSSANLSKVQHLGPIKAAITNDATLLPPGVPRPSMPSRDRTGVGDTCEGALG